MVQRRKGHKGILVWDVSASRSLQKTAIDVGFSVKTIHPKDRKLSDEMIAKKYAKGRYPVCTADKGAYKEMYKHNGAVGFIVIEAFEKKDFGKIRKIFQEFLKKNTAATLRGKTVIIRKDKALVENVSIN